MYIKLIAISSILGSDDDETVIAAFSTFDVNGKIDGER